MSYGSWQAPRAWECICRQAVRLTSLRTSPAPAPTLCEGVNVLLARSEVIEEVQLLSVNDNLVPAQFDELVLSQQAEESLLMPDE